MNKLMQLGLLLCCALGGVNVTQAQQAVLYDFTATWCGPCQQMNPIVHKLEREGLPIRQVDIDREPELARRYNVSSIPAFVMVVNGQEVSRSVGRASEHDLRQMITRGLQKQGQHPASSTPQPPASIVATSHTTPHPQPGQGANGYDAPQLGTAAPFPSMSAPRGAPAAPTMTAANSPEVSRATEETRTASNPNPPGFNDFANTTASNSASRNNTASRDSASNRGTTGAIFRAQMDETSQPTRSAPHIDSRAANVRIRIRDDQGINYGSGTIIESKPGITYVLTCGHIFRNVTNSTKVDVDFFTEGEFESYVGKVEKYDLDADVGMISIPTQGVLPVARLSSSQKLPRESDPVVSVGWSGGQPPSIEDLQVTALNRYTGPDNIECTGTPVQGRSGGGLFNQDNEIIGVCIAADPKEKRGLYAGLAPILELVEGCGLAHLIRNSVTAPALAMTSPPAANTAALSGPADFPGMPSAFDSSAAAPFDGFEAQPSANHGRSGQPPATSPQLTPQIPADQLAEMQAALQAAGGAKLTILIEHPDHPGQTQVVIIPSATARLVADLTGELQARQTVDARRQAAPGNSQPEWSHAATQGAHNPLGQPASPAPHRAIREEDRSFITPTDFPAAEPYRRPPR